MCMNLTICRLRVHSEMQKELFFLPFILRLLFEALLDPYFLLSIPAVLMIDHVAYHRTLGHVNDWPYDSTAYNPDTVLLKLLMSFIIGYHQVNSLVINGDIDY